MNEINGGIYARRSKRDDHNLSPENQVMRCQAYALALARRLGQSIRIAPAHIWVDRGVSGKDFDRPEYIKFRHAIDQHKIEIALVYDIARLGRTEDVTDMLIERRHCMECGVRVWAISEDLELTASDESAVIRFFFGSLQAGNDRKNIRRRCVQGKQITHKLRPDKLAFGGRPVFGYKVEKGVLVPDTDRLPVVTQLFDLAAQGHTAEDIALALNRQGVDAPGGATWYTRTVQRILANPVFVGQGVEVNYTDHDSGEKATALIPAPGLIAPEIFTAAQRQAAMRRRSHKSVRGIFWLSGILKCGKCGRWLVGTSHGPGRPATYSCIARIIPKRFDCEPCDMPIIPASAVEGPIWSDMRAVLSNPAILAEALKDGPDEMQIDNRLSQIGNDIAALRRRQVKLTLQWASDELPPEAIKGANEALRAEIEGLESEGYGLEMRRMAMQRREPAEVDLDNLPPQARAELAQQMIARIDVMQAGPKAVTATVFYYLLPGLQEDQTFMNCQRVTALPLVFATAPLEISC